MTKDRARKLAARERAAITGERYVVARRALELEPPPSGADGVLHRLTHRMPGVPPHADGRHEGRRNRPHRRSPHRPSPRLRPRHGEPRVLVGWQNRIARLFRATRG